MKGSPPRGRGKASLSKRAFPAFQDHPRVGGEKLSSILSSSSTAGSPPRGRGKVVSVGRNVGRVGITPAWAGKSSAPLCCGSESRDHPRVGGEKRPLPPAAGRPLGSPPRGRGKAEAFQALLIAVRITPAWAGKSTLCLRTMPCSPDHPRVGGEKKDRGCKSSS